MNHPLLPDGPPSGATAASMIKKMSSSENEFDIPAKNCHRMVILGSTKVGKTAIISRFLNERVEDQYTPTIEDFHRKFYSIRGNVYQLDILDTSGNHPFPAMRRLSILTGEFLNHFKSFGMLISQHSSATSIIVIIRSLNVLLSCFPGDVFILVFSLDNRDSFQEVQRLKRQIYETKSCLRNKTKENVDVPLVICGNKCDRDFTREVQEHEVEQLVGGEEHCAYFEISAKKNTNVDQMFQTLFTMAKLPNEMSPNRHCKVPLQYCEVLHRKSFRNKKCKDENAYGIVAPFARRPSVHSDLMYIKEKAVGGSQGKEKGCIIC